jgi:hypothetical protein
MRTRGKCIPARCRKMTCRANTSMKINKARLDGTKIDED